MKKKEVLIIFLLAILVTGLSWFNTAVFETCIPAKGWIFGFGLCLMMIPPYPIVQRGFPIYYWTNRPKQTGFLQYDLLVANFLFWFLVIFGAWWVVKWVRRKVWQQKQKS